MCLTSGSSSRDTAGGGSALGGLSAPSCPRSIPHSHSTVLSSLELALGSAAPATGRER